MPEGTVIVSAMEGTVELVSSIGDYGNHIKIQINDVIILYAHCNKLYVKEIYVNEGATLKRMRARAKGSGNRILKRTSHIHIKVAVKE